MKMFRMMVLLMVSALVCAAPVWAQEDAAIDEDKFSFGTVVSVSSEQITVKEYDFAKDADVEVIYDITSETELGNVNAVTDLVVGDDIVLDFTEKDGRRAVMTLVKEEEEMEGAAMDEDVPMDEAVGEEAPAVEDVPTEAPAQQY